MCCKAESPDAEGTPVMSCAGGFVVYLFGMGALHFQCTANCFLSCFFLGDISSIV